MSKIKVALSACLMGSSCRYDGNHNLNEVLLHRLEKFELISFCPEDNAFGTPRPTMDLVDDGVSLEGISNDSGQNLSQAIFTYAHKFFEEHPDIELFIGKDRSPSCAVCSGKVYDNDKNLLHRKGVGLMAQVALDLEIKCWDSEDYLSV